MSKPSRHFYEFGPFRLEPEERRLLRQGEPVELTVKAFDTLLVLVANSGHLVQREQLMSQVWPDATVEEGNLSLAIHTLRKALSNGRANLRYIETVPRHGYRFVAPVAESWEGKQPAGPVGEAAAPELSPEPPARGVPPKLKALWPILGWMLVAIGSLIAGRLVYPRHSHPFIDQRGRSLAVLPFLNLSRDPANQYLSDGITEELTTSLAKLPGLHVAARTSAFQFRNRAEDVRKIGQQLNVATVLEGSVARSGEQLHITAQLINVTNGYHLWSSSYDGGDADLFRIQEQVARETARVLEINPSPQQKFIVKPDTWNPEAHDLYLQARYLWNQRSRGSKLYESIALFQRAIAKDPSYALAYAGLADAYAVEAVNFSSAGPAPQAKAAARKALQLEPTLAEPHAALGLVESQVEWKFREAEQEFQRALELNPDYAPAHHWRALNLTILERFAEAEAELRKAQVLDPLALMITEGLTENFFYWRRYDEAIAQAQRMLQVDPGMPAGAILLANGYRQKKMYSESLAMCKQFSNEAGMPALRELGMATVYAASGDQKHATPIARQLERTAIPPTNLAGLYALLNDRERAFYWLERAYQQHDPHMAYLKLDPLYDSLRHDSRYIELLRKVGLGEDI